MAISPMVPSTRTRAPSASALVAPAAPTTAGIRYSRATTAAWLRMPPGLGDQRREYREQRRPGGRRRRRDEDVAGLDPREVGGLRDHACASPGIAEGIVRGDGPRRHESDPRAATRSPAAIRFRA